MSRQSEIDAVKSAIHRSKAGKALFIEVNAEVLYEAYNSIAESLVDNDKIGTANRFDVDMEKVLSGDPSKWGHPIKPIDYEEETKEEKCECITKIGDIIFPSEVRFEGDIEYCCACGKPTGYKLSNLKPMTDKDCKKILDTWNGAQE